MTSICFLSETCGLRAAACAELASKTQISNWSGLRRSIYKPDFSTGNLTFRIGNMRPIFEWNLGGRSLELGKRTLVMGIVNVTPDSFSDGGQHLAPDAAVAHALRLLDEGADIVDIGGESTRPGASVGKDNPPVGAEKVMRRRLPVITGLKQAKPLAVVSLDPYKIGEATTSVDAAAEILNDDAVLHVDKERVQIA